MNLHVLLLQLAIVYSASNIQQDRMCIG